MRHMNRAVMAFLGFWMLAPGLVLPTVERKAEIAYLSGGIGSDDPIVQQYGNYNLHLVFAAHGTGEYLADVKVVIEDAKGAKVLEADSPGPLFYAKLPSGSYRVTAEYHGTSLRKPVTVSAGKLRDVHFYWRNE